MGLRYPTTKGGVRRATLKYLAAHFLRSLRRHIGLPAARDLDTATAKEISAICYLMSWTDYFLDRERMLLDSLLELHVGERSDYAVAEARGLCSVGFGFMTLNAHGLARKFHVRSGVIAQSTNNLSAIAFANHCEGFLDFYEGRWDDFESRLSRAAAGYKEAGDIHSWGGGAVVHSFIAYFKGDLARTAAMTTELIRAGEGAADPQVAAWGYQNLAYAVTATGPLDEVVAILGKGQSLARKIPSWQNLAFQLALLAKGLVLQGRLVEAGVALDESADVLQREKLVSSFDRVEMLTARATLCLALVDQARAAGPAGATAAATTATGPATGAATAAALHAAHKACDEAVRAARQMPAWLPEALRLQGTASWLRGKTDAALQQWRESVAVARRSGFPIERARAHAEMGRRSGDRAAIEEAITLFERGGAKVFLAFALHHLAQLLAQQSADPSHLVRAFDSAIAALAEVQARAEHDVACAARHRLLK